MSSQQQQPKIIQQINMLLNKKSLLQEETEPELFELADIPPASILKSKINEIQQSLRQWETKENWTYSHERELFFDQIFHLKELEISTLQKSYSFHKTSRESINNQKANQTNDEGSKDSSLPQVISQKALKKQRQLLESPLTVVHLRRAHRKQLKIVVKNQIRYYQVENIIQAINLCLFDMFQQILKQPFTFYKYMVIEHDLSWINNNKTLPKKYQYLNQDLFKRLVIDYYTMHVKYSTKEILEWYDLDLVLEIYFRAVLKIKGNGIGMPENLEDFQKMPKWNELANYFAKHCISRFKCLRETKDVVDINVEIVDKLFEIRLEDDKAYLKVF